MSIIYSILAIYKQVYILRMTKIFHIRLWPGFTLHWESYIPLKLLININLCYCIFVLWKNFRIHQAMAQSQIWRWKCGGYARVYKVHGSPNFFPPPKCGPPKTYVSPNCFKEVHMVLLEVWSGDVKF